jgi:hypothetical protein
MVHSKRARHDGQGVSLRKSVMGVGPLQRVDEPKEAGRLVHKQRLWSKLGVGYRVLEARLAL